jgi:hypothetical protein
MNSDEFWQHEYGKIMEAKDFSGRSVRKGDFLGKFPQGSKPPSTAWNCEDIEPLNPAGNEKHKRRLEGIENWQIANVETNRIKGNKTSFEIDGKLYQVQRNTPTNIQGKRLAPYPNRANPYKGKKYCIIILEDKNEN